MYINRAINQKYQSQYRNHRTINLRVLTLLPVGNFRLSYRQTRQWCIISSTKYNWIVLNRVIASPNEEIRSTLLRWEYLWGPYLESRLASPNVVTEGTTTELHNHIQSLFGTSLASWSDLRSLSKLDLNFSLSFPLVKVNSPMLCFTHIVLTFL